MQGFKLWLEDSPVIHKIKNEYDSLPYIEIKFPTSGWKYIFPDQVCMDNYLNKYRRNVGLLVSKIKNDSRIKAVKIY